ncbi:GMC oxidoreductase [Cohnella sp. CFH 77786]|uniref:GMC oxidoreductase n=1 Tax=Cohnella sp. CFH 77786 TaxID=2662265 RepID=UPI001C60C298|nr:GMC family oxidoreductase [Cohnella sp. CFH 77786]
MSLNPSKADMEEWIPLTPIEKMAQTDYDVIIVGSGAGGGAALWRLCEKWRRTGKRIGLVEAGDLLVPTHAANMPVFNGNRFEQFRVAHSDHVGNLLPDFPNAIILRALGGRTIVWAMESPRFPPFTFETWPISYRELVPYYNIAERVMKVNTSYALGSAIQDILLDRSRSGGLPEAATVPLALDPQVTQFGQVHSNPAFSSIDFMARALNARPFDLAVRTRAVRVLAEKGKVSGIQVMNWNRESYVISARTVIVSASTLETPRLLLHSGIPGEAIGRYLVDHSFVAAEATAGRREFPEVLGTSKIYVPDSEERRFHMLLLGPSFRHKFEEPAVADSLPFLFYSYGPVEPRFENRVFLQPSQLDAYGVPRIDIDFSFSNRDMALIEQMIVWTGKWIEIAKMSTRRPPELWPPGSIRHEAGTCRMGDDPAASACNRYGQIHGISELYVADNSVVPLTAGANPTLTTIALAIRTADYIVETSS